MPNTLTPAKQPADEMFSKSGGSKRRTSDEKQSDKSQNVKKQNVKSVCVGRKAVYAEASLWGLSYLSGRGSLCRKIALCA